MPVYKFMDRKNLTPEGNLYLYQINKFLTLLTSLNISEELIQKVTNYLSADLDEYEDDGCDGDV